MNIEQIKRVYFIGVGGIGMSALARFFRQKNAMVSGYDKVQTSLTQQLINEGINIHFEENINKLDQQADIVIYTPAVSNDNKELTWYRDSGYKVYKRADVLQWITEEMYAITIAGTHGKTTISTLVAHILRDSDFGCNAFLGGISVNYNTNYWGSDKNVAVIEADEYDRSFLKLNPSLAVLTSMDPDHLDIYGTSEEMDDAYLKYIGNIKDDGMLWYKHGIKRSKDFPVKLKKYSYSLQNDAANVYAYNLTMKQGGYQFDVKGDDWILPDLNLNIGGMHNVENAVVAIAIAKQLGIEDELIKNAISSFKGVQRRFEYIIRNERTVYIDDYAHHPEELSSLIKSAKLLFPKKRCVVVFQPHLYSRTKDLARGFARSLDLADEVILLDIYPAREAPIEGVSSNMIADKMGNPNHTLLSKEGLLNYVSAASIELLITSGAGDIGALVPRIKNVIEQKSDMLKIV